MLTLNCYRTQLGGADSSLMSIDEYVYRTSTTTNLGMDTTLSVTVGTGSPGTSDLETSDPKKRKSLKRGLKKFRKLKGLLGDVILVK